MTSTIVKVALENLKAAGVADQVTIVIGPAAESLAKLSSEEPYDLVFIDADKPSNPIYFSEAKRLVRKGGVIVGLHFSQAPLLFFAD
jgi:predicted O-methyltransferase YrrM